MTKDRLFEEQRCERVLARLDSYVDGELLTETNLELLEHFQDCGPCAGEARSRILLRQRVRSAVREIDVPADLAARVRAGLRAPRSQAAGWGRHVMALAACLSVCFSAWVFLQLGAVRTVAGAQEAFISSISARVAAVFRPGLADHVHCAVFGDRPARPRSVNSLRAEIGPEYRDLLPLVREKVPASLDLVAAHQCRYRSRHFVHLAFRDRDRLLSVVIATRESGESFDMAAVPPALSPPGVPVYSAAARNFQIAAFESGRFIVYTISDLPRERNLEIMEALAAPISSFLRTIGDCPTFR